MARFGSLGQQYFDNSGNVLNGGKIHFYESGTTTDKTTYSNVNQTTPNANPVILDSYGRQGNIFFSGSAKAVLLTSADVVIATCDPVGDDVGESQFTTWLDSFSYSQYDVVLYSGKYYQSLQNANLGNTPGSSPTYWKLFIDAILPDQTSVTNKYVAVGNSTTGLTGVSIPNGHLIRGSSSTGIQQLDATAKGTIPAGDGSVVGTLAVGTNNYVLTADSTQTYGMKWAATSVSGCVLLATLTPTAAANVDFLSTFTSSYDNYLILMEGVCPSADDTMLIRFANAGTADTGSNYIAGALSPGASYNTTATSISAQSQVYNAGLGMNQSVWIFNANDATNLKGWQFQNMVQQTVTPDYTNNARAGVYKGVAVSGGRLYWSGGANFKAQGKIRIYGFLN